MTTGRGGLNRPRGENEGRRLITRYEQAKYAAQLRASEHRAEMSGEAGDAFAHYLRTDDSGARPVPDDLLEAWIGRGWLSRVVVPDSSPMPPIPCTVLEVFLGSGTTLAVAAQLGRDGVGIELNPEYVKLARDRIGMSEKPNTHRSERAEDAPLFAPTKSSP